MKIVLFFVVVNSAQVVYGALLDQLNINVATNVGACATYRGITSDQLVALSNLQSPIDTPTQCFLACVARHVGIMHADLTFDKANVINVIKPLVVNLNFGKNVDVVQVTNLIAETCTALPSAADKCLTAKNAFNCFAEIAKKNGL